MQHLESNSRLSNSQWGFRAGKCTVTAFLATTHDLIHLQAGKEICAIFFDFCKAFNKRPHQPLIDKLGNLGLGNHVIQWITSYLMERRQWVVLNDETSKTAGFLSGVPQGLVLGLLLFLIFVDGVMNLPISGGSQLVLYADDILLYRPISRQENCALT